MKGRKKQGQAMTQAQKVIKAKIGLLELAKQLGNVSQACKIMGYSRDSFYCFQGLYAKGGESASRRLAAANPSSKTVLPRRPSKLRWRWHWPSRPGARFGRPMN